MKNINDNKKTTGDGFLEVISFNSYIRELTELLNQKVNYFQEYRVEKQSHPGGYIQGLRKRRIGIAEAFMGIVHNPEPVHFKIRLKALKTLIEMGFYAKSLAMPLNTARVQIAMIKQAIKNNDNKRRQMELMADFSEVSHGREVVVRKFLQEHGLVEVPELDLPLNKLNMGWDSHVHDNLTEGRKTPTQLILDAFIKGISSLTMVHYDLTNYDMIYESLTAGKLLGIDINLAIEFSVGPKKRRKHYMYVFPQLTCNEEFEEFEKKWEKELSNFYKGLEKNSKRRTKLIGEILENFNKTHIVDINRNWDNIEIYGLKPFSLESFKTMVYGNQYSRLHLRDLLYHKLEEINHKRTLVLKTHFDTTRQLFLTGKKTSWELQRIREEYEDSVNLYNKLTREFIEEKYLPDRGKADYNSVFKDEESILSKLSKTGGKIHFIHPLTCGMKNTIKILINNFSLIDGIELINMDDASSRNPEELINLANFVKILNEGNREAFIHILKKYDITLSKEINLEEIMDYYRNNPLSGLCSSDSKGRNPSIPGMGYIRLNKIPLKLRNKFKETHVQIPEEISILVDGYENEKNTKDVDYDAIYSLGKSASFMDFRANNGKLPMTFSRIWQYLNPNLKQFFRISFSAIPALWMVGPLYTIIWFGITFFRNIVVDMIAARGLIPTEWDTKDADMDNASQSLFWTGFSVPLLGYVKIAYDKLFHQFFINNPLFAWAAETVKFFFICIVNGLYISSHNKFRGFDKTVIRANFFRSVLAWPFASIFAPIGNLMGVPSIVQAKFWSDFVAGFIEGNSKISRHFKLCHRDLLEILPMLKLEKPNRCERSFIDILYIWGNRHRGKYAMNEILNNHTRISHFFSVIKNRKENYKINEADEKQYIKSLKANFNDPIQLRSLTDFVIKNYNIDDAEYLMDIITSYYGKFENYLDKIEEKE